MGFPNNFSEQRFDDDMFFGGSNNMFDIDENFFQSNFSQNFRSQNPGNFFENIF